jgi:integral membrane sensor domain MASE1
MYASSDTLRATSALVLAIRAVLAGLAYIVALVVSYYYGGGYGQEASVWLASGVALGVLALADLSRWPAYSAGLGLGAIAANAIAGESFGSSLVFAAEELIVAWGGAWLLRRWIGPRARLDDARKVLIFVGVGAIGTALASLAINIVVYPLLGLPSPAIAWRLWLVSGAVGTLVITPLLFAWADFRPKRSGGATMTDFAWGGPLFVALVCSAVLVFYGETSERFSGSVGYALTYLPFPFLVLGGLVWGPRGATLSSFILAAIAVVYTVRGQGPFAGVEGFLGEDVLEVQGYVAATALLSLMLSALTASRQRALREAADWKTRYEAAICASGQLLYELDPISGRMDWTGDATRFGWSTEKITSLAAYLERIHPDDREAVRSALLELGRGQRRRWSARYRLMSAGRDETFVESDASAIVDIDDSVHRVAGFLRRIVTDTTEAPRPTIQ